MNNIERCIMLHEVLEVHYMVSHYEAQLYTADGRSKRFEAEGETVLEALTKLDAMLEGKNWTHVREAPEIT